MYSLLGGLSAACTVALQLVNVVFPPRRVKGWSDGGRGLENSFNVVIRTGIPSTPQGIIHHRPPFTQRPIGVAFPSMPVSPHRASDQSPQQAIPIGMGMAVPPFGRYGDGQYGDLYLQVREGIIVGQVGALLQTVDA
ncbi:hypothetical protein B0H13DRAFT_1850971 [Mycena leptocephala]|nr:hypothetical protein B0H13DRAFT_1850971 [Mycena leptocephala]